MNFNTIAKIGKVTSKTVGKGVLGMTAAGTLAFGMLIAPWEGRIYVPYYDVGGVLTVCDGITGKGVKLGKTYTDAECDKLAVERVNIHEANVDRCMPNNVALPIETKAAFISFDFNTGRFCNSTLGRKAAAGDLKGACDQLSRWVFVGKQRVRGLENRRVNGDSQRVSERTMCMIGINPSYITPFYEKILVKYKNWRTRVAASNA